MERRTSTDRRPESATLPTRVWVIDPSVQPLGVEPHRIRHAHNDPVPVLEHEESLRLVPRVDRHVLAEAKRVELVHPGVVAPFAASGARDVAKLREWFGVEGPPLRTVLAGGGGAVERAFTLAPVKAGQMPARQCGPVHAVPVHVTAARGEAGVRDGRVVPRQREDFGERGLRRIGAGGQPEYRAGEPEHRSPHRSVRRRRQRVRTAPVLAGLKSPVLAGIDGRVRLHVLVAPAVPIEIQDQRRPSLRFLLVARLIPQLRIQPPDHRTAAARPERPVRVLGKHQVVRAEARGHVLHLLCLGVVHRQVPPRTVEREETGRRMARPRLAEVRIVRRTNPRGDPDAPRLVEHRVVHVRPAGPDRLGAPVRRWTRNLRRRRGRRARVADRHRNSGDGMRLRVEHGQVIGARLEHTVERTVGVDGGIAAVGRDQVVQVGLRVGPVPHGDDDVPLDALRPGRRGRNLARRDPVGPVGEHPQRARAHLLHRTRHGPSGLARLQPLFPRLHGRFEGA